MENASKALIMAAEILFGIILLTILVVFYQTWGRFSSNINDNLETINIQKFNIKFETYADKDLRAQDIISIVNLVNEFNKQLDSGDSYRIKITGNANINKANIDKDKAKFIEDNKNNMFLLKEIGYGETGLVNKLVIDYNR